MTLFPMKVAGFANAARQDAFPIQVLSNTIDIHRTHVNHTFLFIV